MFRCKVCSEKDARIADLKETLRAYLPQPGYVHAVHREADAVMSGQHDLILVEPQREMTAEEREIEAERQRILSGTY
jgi:hypothetical protein